MSVSQKIYYFFFITNVSNDKRMASYKISRDYLYYCQVKPIKYGFKSFVLSDFRSGNIYGMNVFENIDVIENGKMYNFVKNLNN